MSFEVFRKNQKKLLAFLAFFAMIAFSLDFSLIRSQMGRSGEDPVVATLHGKKIKRSDLLGMLAERNRANRFMAVMSGSPDRQAFGGLDTRSLVDALILEKEADRLGIPADRELAVKWLQERTDGQISSDFFDGIYRQYFANEVSDAQLLQDIANQVRLYEVRTLPGVPPVTPLDVFTAYKEQYERTSAKFVAFSAEQFIDKVGQPSEGDLLAYYDLYKNQLSDPSRETPGFKIPRRVMVEYVTADPAELARRIEPLLTEAELRDSFRIRAADFPVPAPEIPDQLFAGEPNLTPSLRDSFGIVRADVARVVARERAEDLLNAGFDAITRKVFEPTNDVYLSGLEAKDTGTGAALSADVKSLAETLGLGEVKVATLEKSLQESQALKKAVETLNQDPLSMVDLSDEPALAALFKQVPLNLSHERTPMLDRNMASNYGQVSKATRGGGPLDPGSSFTELLYDSKRGLFEDVELTDSADRRYVVWKVAEQEEGVPELDQVRDQVVRAWRLEKARSLAKQAAESFAKKLQAPGASFDETARVENRLVVTTTPVPRLQPGAFLGNSFQPEPARPSEIPQLPDASPALRDALFDLEPGQVKVEPSQSKSIYYVLTLSDKTPVTVRNLYGNLGDRYSIELGVQSEANVERFDAWMKTLRAQAGLPEDWVPEDEKSQETS